MNKVASRDSSPNNTFIEGNPSSGKEGTEIPAAWLNDVQEEITGIPFVLEGAAPTPDNKQAGNAIKRAITALDNKASAAITNLSNTTTSAITAAKAEAAKQWCSDYAGNLDAITKPGIYRADTGATSLPAGATVGNFYLLHIQDPDHPNAPLVQQGWSQNGQIWTRYKSSSWGAWSELWHTGNQNYSTLWAELSRAYTIWHSRNAVVDSVMVSLQVRNTFWLPDVPVGGGRVFAQGTTSSGHYALLPSGGYFYYTTFSVCESKESAIGFTPGNNVPGGSNINLRGNYGTDWHTQVIFYTRVS